MSKGKIPDRWIPYVACGEVIEGTRIICFKVPLHKNVQQRVPDITKIWDVPAVLAEIPKLGAVIDLTNTARYYNPRDFEAANVSHRKILMPGREIPPEGKVTQFMDAVDEFLGKDRDSLVGVHCTHGLNRTGYMVCRYMKDRLNIPAEDTIKRFEKARGYQIERDNYKAAILNKKPPPPDLDAKTEERGQERDNNIRGHINDSECGTADNTDSEVNNERFTRGYIYGSNKDQRRYMPYNRPNSYGTHNQRWGNQNQGKNVNTSRPKKRKVYYS